jgi:hypothetical protein
MALLDLRGYLELMSPEAQELQASPDEVIRVLAYAAGIWKELQLEPRSLAPFDLTAAYRHNERTFYHVRALLEEEPHTFVIVITDESGTISDHILIDLAAMYCETRFECPEFGFDGPATPQALERALMGLREEMENPFAILSSSEGTYLQTICTVDGFSLEYQLVNPSSHYESVEFLTAKQVVAAFNSYMLGDNNWLNQPWQKMGLA